MRFWLGTTFVMAGIVSATWCAGEEASAASQPSEPALTMTIALRDLGAPGFAARERATEFLQSIGPEQLPSLVTAYQQEPRFEVRLRLRHVIEHLFYQKYMEGRTGFLGVQPSLQTEVYDPRTGQAGDAILFVLVLKDNPAERAGLLTGDMLVEFDGRSIHQIVSAARKPEQGAAPAARPAAGVRAQMSADPKIDAFTIDVARRSPGAPVNLRLLRPQAERQVGVTVAADPVRTLEGVSLTPTTLALRQERGPQDVVPVLRYGLQVTQVGPAAAKIGFIRDDVILGIEGTSLQTGVALDQLKNIFKVSGPAARIDLKVVRIEQVEKTMTLGGRSVARINPNDMELAHERFAEWWRSGVGEVCLRAPWRVPWYNAPFRQGFPAVPARILGE